MSTSILAPVVLSFFLLSFVNQGSSRQSANSILEKVEAPSVNVYSGLDPEIELTELTKDFMQWWNYSYYNIRLGREFVGLDVNATLLDKENFLNKLSTGKFVAIKLKVPEGNLVYRLYSLANLSTPMESIQRTAARMAQTELRYLQMQGKSFLNFDVLDVNGKGYNQNTLLGKLTIIKTWFIKCTACIEEFPQVNKLVDHYQDNSKIQFLSLARDSQPDLIKFLQEQPLKYAVIPNMKSYIEKDLMLTAYPTHLVIGPDAKIMKVFENLNDMQMFIASEVVKL